MKRNAVAWAALVVSTAALVSSQGLTRPVPAAPKMPVESQRTAASLSDAFVAVAEFSKPSVVQISVQRKGGGGVIRVPGGQGRRSPFQVPPGNGDKDSNDLDMLREMLKRFGNPDFRVEPQQFGPGGGGGRGTGSGFIFDDRGHILTNNHVVESAGKIVVKFHDGIEAPATVVGTDPKSDIAVIKVENTSYPALPRGLSHKLRVGELVMAVGSPFGLSQSVTMGIVSATERNDLGLNDANDAYESFIQTDAPINPGNSGGPLIDMDGRVVGINSAIMTGGRGNDGVGFAVPIDLASNVAEKLIKDGKVSRARIGVAIQPLSPAEAKHLGIDAKAHGVLVGLIAPGSPAEKAGLKSGDVIVSFNKHPVLSVPTFRLNVAASEIGKPYTITYYREGKEHTTSVVLGSSESIVFDQEKEKESAKEPEAKVETAKAAVDDFGFDVQPLTAEMAKALGLQDAKGLIVSSVKEGGPAEAAGVQQGDVVTQIVRDHKPQSLTSVKELKDFAGKSDEMMIYIQSAKKAGFVTLSKLKKD